MRRAGTALLRAAHRLWHKAPPITHVHVNVQGNALTEQQLRDAITRGLGGRG